MVAAPRGFHRSLKLVGALLLTLSAITPAASVAVIIPGIILQAGTGALASLGFGALVALAIAYVYAELGSAHPIAGGDYALIGKTLGPFAGFTYLGVRAVSVAFAPGVLCLGAAGYLKVIWPAAPAVPVAIGIIWFATALGVLNIRTNAFITGAFLAVELAILAILAVLGFSAPSRSLTDLVLHPVTLTGGHLVSTSFAAIGLAAAVAIFAYDGFGVAVYFGEETVGASRRVARTILVALFLTVAFEFIPTLAVLIGAPDLKALLASPTPFSDFIAQRGGNWLAIAVSLGVALAIINAMIAIVLVYARFFYSSGRDQAWAAPINAALTRISPRFGSPWVANLTAGGLASLGCFVPFQALLVFTGAVVVFTYALLCWAVIAGRLNGSTAHGVYRMPLYPVTPVLALVALAYVVWANWADPIIGRPSVVAFLAIALISVVYCLVMRRRRGPGWSLAGPSREEAS
ncbi:MAG TPA: APC family permease [Caulobacteraceae bacterium]|jgi:amino acid transporter